jgi:hypothetical protein
MLLMDLVELRDRGPVRAFPGGPLRRERIAAGSLDVTHDR